MEFVSYRVTVHESSVYELISSLAIYFKRKWTRNLDIGASWLREVDELLPTGFIHRLEPLKEMPYAIDYLLLLVWIGPEHRDADDFIAWLKSLSPGELYEKLAPYVSGTLPNDLKQFRDVCTALLSEWNTLYYRTFGKDQADLLHRDAEEKRRMAERLPATEVVEKATGGLVVHETQGLTLVVLTPSLHFRPTNNVCSYEDMAIIQYPVDPPMEDTAAPPLALMRLTRALSDESRIRILRYLAGGPRTFTEVAQFTELTKGTVHHHLTNLRAAGLIRTHFEGKQERFEIRGAGLTELSDGLVSYLNKQ